MNFIESLKIPINDTLFKKRDWSGLLVEPDPFYYTQLVGKNRHSWSINGGISPYNYMSEVRESVG